MSFIFRKSLSSSIKLIKDTIKSPVLYRTLTTSKILADNYEGDGKTTVTILNRENKHLIMFDTFNNIGFRLNNGIFAMGPVAAFPRTILQWNVNGMEDVTPESLSLFCLLEPKIDILILGTGDKRIMPSKNVLEFLKSNKISVEVLPTYQACSIFNFLNAEGRYIAGALLPPEEIQIYEDEFRILGEIDAIDRHEVVPDPKITK